MASQLSKIQDTLADYPARLVAVSKTRSQEQILKLYDAGQRIFGENRVQELIQKVDVLPEDIEWHLIGHLQRNKVKYIAPFVQLIHSVDSLSLLETINKEAKKHDRIIDCLLQFKVAVEESKYGLSIADGEALLHSKDYAQFKNIRIVGVMGMATFTSDPVQVREEFKQTKAIFEQLQSQYFSEDSAFKEISMGMSGDYLIALEEGSSLIRVGSLLFKD